MRELKKITIVLILCLGHKIHSNPYYYYSRADDVRHWRAFVRKKKHGMVEDRRDSRQLYTVDDNTANQAT